MRDIGDNWHRDLAITQRADAWYWLVHMAEAGLEAKRQRFREAGPLGACEIASLADWRMNLEGLVLSLSRRRRRGCQGRAQA